MKNKIKKINCEKYAFNKFNLLKQNIINGKKIFEFYGEEYILNITKDEDGIEIYEFSKNNGKIIFEKTIDEILEYYFEECEEKNDTQERIQNEIKKIYKVLKKKNILKGKNIFLGDILELVGNGFGYIEDTCPKCGEVIEYDEPGFYCPNENCDWASDYDKDWRPDMFFDVFIQDLILGGIWEKLNKPLHNQSEECIDYIYDTIIQ